MSYQPAAASGILVAAAPLPVAAAGWSHGPTALDGLTWIAATAGLATLAFTLSGLAICSLPRTGRWLATLGIVGTLALLVEVLLQSPPLALAALLGAAASLSSLWGTGSATALASLILPLDVGRARSAALTAVGFWLAASLANRATVLSRWAVAASLLVATLLAIQWLVRSRADHRIRAGLILGAIAAAGAGIALSLGNWARCVNIAVLVPVVTAVVLPAQQRRSLDEHEDWWEPIIDHPARFLVATFFALCLGGTLILALPACSASGEGIALVDAAFTAVSAVCVTGLSVLDTAVAFSFTGQLAILILIQLGGLGIMTFSTAAIRLLGRRMSLRHEGVVAGLMSDQDRSKLFRSTRRLILFTLCIEGTGAALLIVLFWQHGASLPEALWHGVFTAVSAFCNAGFALQSQNLVPYQQAPAILHVVALLIIAGGLSPLVALSIPVLVRGTPGVVSAQNKLALATTVVLLLAGVTLVAAMEWNNTLGHLPFWDRLHNAWFQSVTLRTAGFNSVDISTVHPETLSIMLLWMFIGGNPGSTAGGIKTTTAAVLFLAVIAAIRGRANALAFGRSISHKTVYRAAAITTVGAATVFVSLIAVQLTQAMPTRLAVFEVISALGTVGLTIGGTPALDGVGKIIIMSCMFMGRVGPLTLFMFLSNRVQHEVWKRPEADIEVG